MKKHYAKAFVLSPDAVLAGLEGITNLFDKKTQSSGSMAQHLVVIPEDFLVNPEAYVSDVRPWDRDGIRELRDYVTEHGIVCNAHDPEKDYPLRKDLGLFLRVAPSRAKKRKSQSLVDTIKKIEKESLDEIGKKGIVVLSNRSQVRTQLTLNGFTVAPIKHKEVDPNIAKRYVTLLGPEDYELIQRINKERRGNRTVSQKTMNQCLGIDDESFFANQYVLLPQTKNQKKYDALRLNSNGVFETRNLYTNLAGIAGIWQPGIAKDAMLTADRMWEVFTPEQLVYLDLAYDPNILAIAVVGSAGTGKTSIAYASMLSMIARNNKTSRNLDQLYLLKSLRDMTTDERIGFEPGDRKEKLRNKYGSFALLHQQTTVDTDFWSLFDDPRSENTTRTGTFTFTKEKPPLTALLVNDIAGYTISNAGLLIDEAQNLDVPHAQRIMTRQGPRDTLFVFCGDIRGQIDNPHYDEQYNTLSALVNEFRGSPHFAAVQFSQSHRSSLARKADRWKTY